MTLALLILAGVMLYIVIKIVAEIIEQRKCITEKQIDNFMKGRLGEYERNKVISHLGLCEKCRQKLEEHNFGDNIEDHLVE